MAVWQICETFSAKLLITAVFFPSPPRFAPSKNSQQSEQPIRTYVGLEAEEGEGARMCRHHRADTDDKSSTYGQLSHRPT